MRTKVILTPYDKILSGKFPADAEHIYVLLDTTSGPFTVHLPDCRNTNQNEFIFKNIGTNKATIAPITGQYIDTSLLHVLNPWDLVSVWSDSVKRWILLDSNSNILPVPLQIGEGANNTTIEADGTIVNNGSATTWEDVNFPLIVKTTGTHRPTYATYSGTLESLQWAVDDIAQAIDNELPHAHKNNSTMTWHVHFYTGSQDASNRYVKWEIAYTGSNYDAASPAETVISAEYMIPANTPALTHIILNIGTYAPTDNPGFHVKARLKRITASGTAPSVNPFCELMQLHAEKDMNGSRTITTK